MTTGLKRKHVLAAAFRSANPSAAYQAKVLADGAVAYWPLDETSGTTAIDRVGTRHGTISGSVILNQVGIGGSKAMDFGGGNIALPSIPSLLPAFTHEAWIYKRTNGSNHRAWLSRITDRTFNHYSQTVNNLVCNLPSIVNLSMPGGILLTWQHVVFVWDGTTLFGYLNGVSVATPATISIPSDTGVGVGRIGNGDVFGTPIPWDGLLQDIAIYSRALSPAEILAHYQIRVP